MTRVIANHGDIVLKPIDTRTPVEATEAKLHILQDSGATGNRHEVVSKTNIYRWTEDGHEYLHSDTSFIIQHVGGDEEHGVQSLEAGTWEVLHEMEHDPWTNELKIVID